MPVTRFILVLFLAAVVTSSLFLAGCDKNSGTKDTRAGDPPPRPVSSQPPAAADSAAATQGVGTIRGKITFAGQHPAAKKIDTGTICPRHSPLFDESLVLNPNGTLKNVLVYLKETPPGPSQGTPPPAPRPTPILDQIECQYVPHVVAVQTNHPLIIKSSDDALHNVHLIAEKNPSSNKVMNGKTQRDYTFKEAEIIRAKCDVHPWMSAYVGVFDHPYFAVTGDDGSYELRGVPAGKYTLVAWQETLDTQEQPVTVLADQSTAADVNFKAE